MKGFVFVATLTLALFAGHVRAQFTIRQPEPERVGPRAVIGAPRPDSLYNPYFSRAAWRAERRRIRHERNKVEFNAALQTSMQQFENWTAGGDNTFSAVATLYFRHQYRRERFNVDYGVSARYGMNLIDSKPFKNVDEFKITVESGWKLARSWSYSATANLRSQFATGYVSRDDRTKISSFMAPGFFDVAIGFTYGNDRSPFKLTFSPVGGNLVTMVDDEIPEDYKGDDYRNGVPVGSHVKGKIGPSINIFFDKAFGKKEFIRYRTTLYTFTNFTTAPTVRWENNIDIRISRYVTTTLYGLVYYLKDASTALQYQYAFTIGLAYKFSNK